MNFDDLFSKMELDEEIQDLLKFSVGFNLGLYFFFGAIIYDFLVFEVDFYFVFKVVLLDSLINNIDWIVKNINLFNWNRELWLIDYGVSFYFYYNWKNWCDYFFWIFFNVKDYVFLVKVNYLFEVFFDIWEVIDKVKIVEIIFVIFEEWLIEEDMEFMFGEKRSVYQEFLNVKLDKIDVLAKEVLDVKQSNL